MRSTIASFLLLLAHLSTTTAQTLTPSVGPESGPVYEVITRGDSEVLAETSDGIILRSFDNGENWANFRAPDSTASRLFVDSADNLFIASEQSLYAEDPTGSGWVAIHNGTIRRFAAAPDGTLWIIDADSMRLLRRVADGSGEWMPIPELTGAAQDVAVTPDSALWVAIGASVYRSASGEPLVRHGEELIRQDGRGGPDTIRRLIARPSGNLLAIAGTGVWVIHPDSIAPTLRLKTDRIGEGLVDLRQDRQGRIFIALADTSYISDDGLRSFAGLDRIAYAWRFGLTARNDTYEFGAGKVINGRRSSSAVSRRRVGSTDSLNWAVSYGTAFRGDPDFRQIDFDGTSLFLGTDYLSSEPHIPREASLPLTRRRTTSGEGRYWSTIRGDQGAYPFLDETVAVWTTTHILYSRNHGRTWDSIAIPEGRYRVVRPSSIGNNRFLVQTHKLIDTTFIYSIVSIDDGTWTDYVRPIDGKKLPWLRAVMLQDGTLWNLYDHSGLIISRDTGRTWHVVVDSLNYVDRIVAVVKGADGASVALGADGRSYVDQGGPNSWRQSADTAAPGVHSGVGSALDGIIYFGRNNGSVYRSRDNGDSWAEIATLPEPDDYPINMTATEHGKLFVATHLGYLYAIDIPASTNDVPVVKRVGRLDLW